MKEYSVLGYISGTPTRGSAHRGTTKQHAMKLMLTVSPCGSQRINEVALPLHIGDYTGFPLFRGLYRVPII